MRKLPELILRRALLNSFTIAFVLLKYAILRKSGFCKDEKTEAMKALQKKNQARALFTNRLSLREMTSSSCLIIYLCFPIFLKTIN